MTKNKLFAWAITLLCFSLTSCSDEKDGPSKKILVTNAGVTEANQTVKPGDIVHIYGDGFQEGDQVEPLSLIRLTDIPRGLLKN